ncbi:aldo/keto reductase [Leptospirillum ferriphilum]|jgi:aryl-alcohol dehydrogenase-like predicted oxidoreductase|uniref:Aldo/keto reductase family protein n=3 Tax=Leptospirillum TaxID=179 RepID=A0A2I2MHT5_9BACT|nr:aldo/keto reductase [Leptospirillum ferriphilum]EDZ39352.1 MAG: oxidoreductase/K+-channel protein [Leptospirillum sp. Group II '5-way CG']
MGTILKKVAKELDRSMPQVAINWVFGKPEIGAAILGATNLSQLQNNRKALDFSIPEPL